MGGPDRGVRPVSHLDAAAADESGVNEVVRQGGAAAPAAAAEQAARTMLLRVLGPDGVAGSPLVSHDEVTATATELVQHLLQVDDCWVQSAGEFAESFARSGADQGGAWLGNPVLSTGTIAGTAGRFRGALGAAPFWVGGERRVLMVHAATPRAWTRWDHVVLREAAVALEAALEATLGHQRTPAQEARERYDELRRQLLTVLNHELRTPLTSLSAGMEMLEDLTADLSPAVARVLARMERNIARLLDLSDNVTTLGDVASPRSRVDAARFDPADAVHVARLCVAGLDPVVVARVDVEVEAAGPVPVALPVGELREVLDRVLSNAVKFSPPDSRIEVRVARRTSRVTVAVTDAGPGVPEDEQHGIGQPFFRASTAWDLEKQGAGLGLAAATAIVRPRGGTVELATAPAGGTVVTVRVPAAECPPEPGGERS